MGKSLPSASSLPPKDPGVSASQSSKPPRPGAGGDALAPGGPVPTLPPFRVPDPSELRRRRAIWKRLRRLVGLEGPSDELQVTVFGPLEVVPGQTARLMVNLHRPESAESVHTLARALQSDAELLGSGPVLCDVFRDSEVATHVAVAGAGVAKSLATFTWRGQPRRLLFDLHIPWEAGAGPAAGVVSVGYNKVRVAKVEISLNVLRRKG